MNAFEGHFIVSYLKEFRIERFSLKIIIMLFQSDLMHGSILACPPGFAYFILLNCIFPTPRHIIRKRLFPTPGTTLTNNCDIACRQVKKTNLSQVEFNISTRPVFRLGGGWAHVS